MVHGLKRVGNGIFQQGGQLLIRRKSSGAVLFWFWSAYVFDNRRAKTLWLLCISWWGVYCVFSETVMGWMASWKGLCPAPKNERDWSSLFGIVVWTILETRNQHIFEGKISSVEEAGDLVKFRLIWWFKHHGEGSTDSVEMLLRDVKELCVDYKVSVKPKIADWIPPKTNFLKFNVDGSTKGKPRPAGIGGVLRASNGKIICLFSLYVGIMDSNAVDIWAIGKVVELCQSKPDICGRNMVVVSDSKIVVSWVNKGEFRNLNRADIISNIRDFIGSTGTIEVIFESRSFNSFADSPTKMGSSLSGDFVEWGDVGLRAACAYGSPSDGVVMLLLAV
ncbi:hypothetical protein Ddye_011849 [Dipteronia dyeriana]|uniref:RNase H type-1 domain-containing protein n=1 Tax=Dipteronia dyeriana TaxID=168575 RepID=A0AAD9X371_9ROSI|nr:hypothetical protein Ddye_011849 [Dipteronia dyeriana]